MKMCEEHWEALIQGVKDRGLWHLVSRDTEELAERITAALDGKMTPQEAFDPLMAANGAIAGAALQAGGLYLMSGDYCPLCEVKAHSETPDNDKVWIEGCLDDQLQYALEEGLVSRQ